MVSRAVYGGLPAACGVQSSMYVPSEMIQIAGYVKGNIIIGNVVIKPDGMTVDGQTVTDAGELYAALMAALGGKPLPDQGAAVRGEAVAKYPSEDIVGAVARGWCAPGCTDIEMDSILAYAIAREVQAIWPISPRAADAPSEPSEREKMLENALNLMLDEKADYMRLNKLGDPTCETTYRVAQRALNIGKSRAADALDSQPTERPTDDELWDATLRDRDAYHEWADKLADAIAAHFGVDSMQELIDAQEQHILKLQAKLPRDTQPAFTRVREG